MYVCIYEFYSVKPSHFIETKIYVKLDPTTANTVYHLKSGTICSQWNYLSYEIINKLLIRYKIMKNQGQNKNRNNTFDSLEFIYGIYGVTGNFRKITF